jgi:hypothetical protein
MPVHPTIPPLHVSHEPVSDSPSPKSARASRLATPIGLVWAVCTVCRQTRTLSLSAPSGFVCFACRVARQPVVARARRRAPKGAKTAAATSRR